MRIAHQCNREVTRKQQEVRTAYGPSISVHARVLQEIGAVVSNVNEGSWSAIAELSRRSESQNGYGKQHCHEKHTLF